MSYFKRGSSGTSTITLVLAGLIAVGAFAFFTSQNVDVLVAKGDIPVGTKITSDMIGTTIQVVSVPKDLTNEFSITNQNQIIDTYVLNNLSDGKLIFSTDIASEKNLRENKYLKELNLEAVTIERDKTTGITNSIATGDRLNLYSIIDVSISSPEGLESVEISSLHKNIQDILIENGYKIDQTIGTGDYTFSKLLVQNVPVVEVERGHLENEGNEDIKTISVGLKPEESEMLYLTMNTGKVGISILPFSEKDYEVEDTKGGTNLAAHEVTNSSVSDLKKSKK